jgi:phosphoglycolate phosphatase-like HAD superfamily hydrolase
MPRGSRRTLGDGEGAMELRRQLRSQTEFGNEENAGQFLVIAWKRRKIVGMSKLPKYRTLIIFDVDGTLVDAHVLDNASFNHAFTEITGVTMTESLWSSLREVTSQATIHQALGKERNEDMSLIKDKVRDAFLTKLNAGHGLDPVSINAFAGAVELVSHLKNHPELSVAIATGCWKETAHFKLNAAGFDLDAIPFACASDCYSRAEIIALAVERAGKSLDQTVYVGDGLWDLRATQQLGIPFIGVGGKIEELRKAGARYTLEGFSADGLQRVLKQIQEDDD